MAEEPKWHCKLHDLDFDSPWKFAAHKRHYHRRKQKKMKTKKTKAKKGYRPKTQTTNPPPVAQVVLSFCPFCGDRLPNAHVGG